MSSLFPENGRLDGWKAISDYLGWHTRTVMRWERHRGLPIHRVPGGQRHAVFAFRQELDEWLRNGKLEHDDFDDQPGLPPDMTTGSPEANVGSPIELDSQVTWSGTGRSVAYFPFTANHRSVIWITVGLLLLMPIGYTLHSLANPPRIQLTNVLQLTNDGQDKEGLVTDGKTIYFGEHKGIGTVLSSISSEGGTVRMIATPFVQAVPVDISHDGKQLLVLAREGVEVERALWAVPTNGEKSSRIGQIRCHAAAWSPDGRSIVFANQNAIYTATADGASIKQIQSFDATPEYFVWSPNGNRIQVILRNQKNATISYWELTFNEHYGNPVSSLAPLWVTQNDCWAPSMALDHSGHSFIVGGSCGQESLFLLQKGRGRLNQDYDVLDLNSPINGMGGLASDWKTRKIYMLGEYAGPKGQASSSRLELFKFDTRSFEFIPFLPGLSANEVAFSKDGSLIAYIREPEQTLWISSPDGTDRQIETQASHLELPRFSPNGRALAFMAKFPGKPWRIYIVSIDGGSPREASAGSDSQGAPTWSPDGRWLVYGNVECQEEGNCAIHKIDIATGREYTVPGSDGLGTARWSPDGRFIAALNPIERQVMLFDATTQRWRKLVGDVNGNDLSWSADSQYVFASRPAGGRPQIIRIALNNAKVETALDLQSFSELSGQISKWFALTPDGSILFSREMAAKEIYSLGYEEK